MIAKAVVDALRAEREERWKRRHASEVRSENSIVGVDEVYNMGARREYNVGVCGNFDVGVGGDTKVFGALGGLKTNCSSRKRSHHLNSKESPSNIFCH